MCLPPSLPPSLSSSPWLPFLLPPSPPLSSLPLPPSLPYLRIRTVAGIESLSKLDVLDLHGNMVG